MVRVVVLGVALALGASPAAVADPSPAPSPPPAGTLPFGRLTIGPTGLDRSGIVWSLCRAADGRPGRWVTTETTDVVRPTYILEPDSVRRFVPAAESAKLGMSRFVECVGSHDEPGTPDPAVPPTAVLPLGTKLVYASGVWVHRSVAAASEATEFTFSSDGSAVADAAGPFIVSRERIVVFPPSYTIDATRTSRSVSIVRPGSPPPRVPAASCAVVVFDGREHRVATLRRPCTELSSEERVRAIDDARATIRP